MHKLRILQSHLQAQRPRTRCRNCGRRLKSNKHANANLGFSSEFCSATCEAQQRLPAEVVKDEVVI